MFKDKQLREALKEVGILKPDLELYRSYDWMSYVGAIARKKINVCRIKTDVERLQEENKELKQRMDALMELLGITYEEAHEEPAKLKKGSKTAEIKPRL